MKNCSSVSKIPSRSSAKSPGLDRSVSTGSFAIFALALGFTILTTFSSSARADGDAAELSAPEIQQPTNPSAELNCMPYAHAQGTTTNVQILRETRQARVTMGSLLLGRRNETQAFTIAERSQDPEHGSIHYVGDNFELILDPQSKTADVHMIFEGREQTLKALQCQVHLSTEDDGGS